MSLLTPAKDGLSPKATAQFNLKVWSTIPHKSQLVTLFQKELVFWQDQKR